MAFDLTPFIGAWQGTWRTWIEPDILHDESPIHLEAEPLLDGRDLVVAYEASIAGDPVEGWALIGPTQEGYVVAWVDSWHTSGLVFTSHGRASEEGIDVATEFRAERETWVWSSLYHVAGDRLVLRHFNEGPGVPRYLGVEAVLSRAG